MWREERRTSSVWQSSKDIDLGVYLRRDSLDPRLTIGSSNMYRRSLKRNKFETLRIFTSTLISNSHRSKIDTKIRRSERKRLTLQEESLLIPRPTSSSLPVTMVHPIQGSLRRTKHPKTNTHLIRVISSNCWRRGRLFTRESTRVMLH